MNMQKNNFREDDNYLKEDNIEEDDTQNLPKKNVKKQFILRRRIEEDIKNSKQYNTAGGKLLQPQVQNKKKSFQQMAKLASQQQKITNILPSMISSQNSLLNDNKPRDTIFSQQSIGNYHKQDDKKKKVVIEEDEYTPEVNGPQVQLSKKDVSFIVNTGLVAFENVVVKNNGSASIYYEWKRIENTRTYSSTLLDPEQKFFCHHEQNVIKPGQSKRFVFAFMSKVTGIFFEEWELQCEPPTTQPISRLKLTGNSIEVDSMKEGRQQFDKESLNHFVSKGMNEIVNDIISQVRTPTPPLPDLNDPIVCAREFEEKNSEKHLWYNPLVMKWWRILEQDLYEEIQINPEHQYWDLNLDYINDFIQMVDDEDNKNFFQTRYSTYIELNKRQPVERSQIYPQVRDFIQKLACGIPVMSDKIKEEIGMWDYVFRPPLNERDFTDQEMKLFEDEKTKIKTEWIKKTKKKKWVEEDDKKMIDDYRNALSNKISSEVYNFFEGFEEKDIYNRALDTIQSRKEAPNSEHFELLLRKKPLKDLDIEGKRIMLKVHLKMSSEPGTEEKKNLHIQRLIQEKEEYLKKIEEEKSLQEKMAKEKKKIAKRPPPTVTKGKGKQIVEEDKPHEKLIDVSFLDEDNLQDIMDCIKYLFERQAKLVIVMVSYDIPLGEYRFTSSVKFFAEYMKKQIENPVVFNESIYIENFEEKVETESFPDSSVLVLENSYFVPEEIGFKMIRNSENNDSPSLMKQNLEDKKHYIETISSYCPSLVIEDKYNFFSRMTSLLNMQFENQVLGQRISEDIQQVAHMVSFTKNPFHVFIGGPLTPSKLIAIDSLACHAHKIYLYGQIGIKFFIVQQEIWQEEKLQGQSLVQGQMSPKMHQNASINPSLQNIQASISAKSSEAKVIMNVPFNDFPMTPIEKIAIRGTISSIKTKGRAQIVLPQDFLVVPDIPVEGAEKLSPPWLEKQLTLAQNYPPRINNSPSAIEQLRRQTADERRSTFQEGKPILEEKKQIVEEKKPTRQQDRKSLIEEKKTQDKRVSGIVEDRKSTTFALDSSISPLREEDGENNEEDQLVNRKLKMLNEVIEDVEEDMDIQNQYDLNALFPVGHIVIDFGEKTLATIRKGVKNARKLAWFEPLSILSSAVANQADKMAAKTLHQMQQQKRARLDTIPKDQKSYNYENDLLVFAYGKSLEKQLNLVDLSDVKQRNEPNNATSPHSEKNLNEINFLDNQEDDQEINPDKQKEDDDKSIHSTATAVSKPKTIRVISDFYSKDSDFVFRILDGSFIEALDSIQSYTQKSSSNLSDELSFLDRL